MGTPSRPLKLNPASIDFLLELLEQPQPVLARSALEDHLSHVGPPLIEAGLLVPSGFEEADSSLEHDDLPIRLIWDADQQNFGYFSPTRGWVVAEEARMTLYRVDVAALCAALVQLFPNRTSRDAAPAKVSDQAWDLGEIRIPHRTKTTPAMFARRLHDPIGWRLVRKSLVERPAPRMRIVLCSTHLDRLPDDPPRGNALFSVRELIGSGGELAINPEKLASLLDRPTTPAGATEPLVVLGDGHEVRLYGKVFRFSKGTQQRRIIVALFQRYQQGELEVGTTALLTDLKLPDGARFGDYFKHHRPPVMGRLLWERAGLCGFCLKP